MVKLKINMIIFLAVFYILFIFYRFFFIERIPYNILTCTFFTLLLIFILLLINLINLRSFILQLIKREPGEFSIMFSNVINYIYWKPLSSLDIYLRRFTFIKQLLSAITLNLLTWIGTKNMIYLILIIFIILPRLIVGISLLIDVLYFERIELMYITLIIIIIPLIFETIIYMCKNQAIEIKEYLEKEYLNIKLENNTQVYISKNSHTDSDTSFTLNKNLWLHVYNFIDLYTAISLVKLHSLFIFLRILCTLLYIIGWSCYLYIVITHILLLFYITYKVLTLKIF